MLQLFQQYWTFRGSNPILMMFVEGAVLVPFAWWLYYGLAKATRSNQMLSNTLSSMSLPLGLFWMGVIAVAAITEYLRFFEFIEQSLIEAYVAPLIYLAVLTFPLIALGGEQDNPNL